MALKYRTFEGVFYLEKQSFFNGFWLIPAFVPYFAALFGAFTYITLISAHHPSRNAPTTIAEFASSNDLKIHDENSDETKNLFQDI